MGPTTMLIVVFLALAVSAAVWFATGGHFAFFFLPLLFGLPFLGRRRDRAPGSNARREHF